MTLHEWQFDEFFKNPLPHEGFTIEEPAQKCRIGTDDTLPSCLPQESGEQDATGTQPPWKTGLDDRKQSGLRHNWKKYAAVVGLSIVAFLLVKSLRLSRGSPNIE